MNKIAIVKNTMKNKNFTVEIQNEHSPRFSTHKQAMEYAKNLVTEHPRFIGFEIEDKTIGR